MHQLSSDLNFYRLRLDTIKKVLKKILLPLVFFIVIVVRNTGSRYQTHSKFVNTNVTIIILGLYVVISLKI